MFFGCFVVLLISSRYMENTSDSKYLSLLEELKKNPGNFDYQSLRDIYPQTSLYDPYSGSISSMKRDMFAEFDKRDYKAGARLAEKILEDHEELLSNSTRILSKRDCSKMEWTGSYRSWKKRVLIPITLRCLL